MGEQIATIDKGLSILAGVSTIIEALAELRLEDAPALILTLQMLEKAFATIDQANDSLKAIDKVRAMTAEGME